MKTDPPLVTAIIIFLNEERFLQEAIDSVWAQTYRNWELLLVDDGSSDASTAIAGSMTARHPEKVRYFEHTNHANLGMSASRNLGVRNACGTYISYLDGDDVWLPKKLEEQVAILDAHPQAAFVCGPLWEWHSWNPDAGSEQNDHLYGVGPRGVHPLAGSLVSPPALLKLFLEDEEFIPAAALIRRTAMEEVGGGEEDFKGSYEDAVVFVKICLKKPAFVSSNCWYKYRIHANSCERQVALAGQGKQTWLRYMTWVDRYLSASGVIDDELFRILRRSMRLARYPILLIIADPAQAKYTIKLYLRRKLPVYLYSQLRNLKNLLTRGRINWNSSL